MITIADIKERLKQFDDDMEIVLPVPVGGRELMLSPEVDYWEPDDGASDLIHIKALAWKVS